MPTFNPRRIVFAVYKGVSLLDLAGPLEAFRVADAFSPSRNGRTMYECTVVSSRGGRVMTADGVELATKPTRSLAKKAIDTVVVPGGFQVDDVTRDRALVQWIRNIAPGCKVSVRGTHIEKSERKREDVAWAKKRGGPQRCGGCWRNGKPVG